jgi:cysteine desulfurase
MIYLDNNATTPVDPEVYNAILSSLKRDFGNPSSNHDVGRRASEVLSVSREAVADLVGSRPGEIYFTSGGTESNNLSVIGTAHLRRNGHIITSVIEHPSIINPCRHLELQGFEVTYVPVDSDGIIRVDEIESAIKKSTFLISIMHSNNETGVIQPIEKIGKIAKENNTVFHVDAAQSIGKVHFKLDSLPIDMMTLVSHKFYGPKGIGALYVRKGVRLKPILFGAGHENGLRPGTENVPSIVGFAKACDIAKRDMDLRVGHTTSLRELLFEKLKLRIPDIKLNGHVSKRLPNTLNICIPGVNSHDLVEHIKDRVAASTGSACHSGRRIPSGILKSMGLTDKDAVSSIRLSAGKDNTEEEILRAVEIIADAVDKLKE